MTVEFSTPVDGVSAEFHPSDSELVPLIECYMKKQFFPVRTECYFGLGNFHLYETFAMVQFLYFLQIVLHNFFPVYPGAC